MFLWERYTDSVYSDQESLAAFFEHLSVGGTNDTLNVSVLSRTAFSLRIDTVVKSEERGDTFVPPSFIRLQSKILSLGFMLIVFR